MIPDKTDPRWKDLLGGKINHQLKFTAAAMCVSRNIREISTDRSPERLNRGVDEIHSLFSKYESLAGDDLKAIFGK